MNSPYLLENYPKDAKTMDEATDCKINGGQSRAGPAD